MVFQPEVYISLKKNITTPLPNGAMEPREPGDPADGSETEKSLAALFFYFVLEKWFSIEERLSPLH